MIDLAQVHNAKCENFNRQCHALLLKLVACRPEEKIKGQRDKEEILVLTISAAANLASILDATVAGNKKSPMSATEELSKKLKFLILTLQSVAYDMFKDDVMKG